MPGGPAEPALRSCLRSNQPASAGDWRRGWSCRRMPPSIGAAVRGRGLVGQSGPPGRFWVGRNPAAGMTCAMPII